MSLDSSRLYSETYQRVIDMATQECLNNPPYYITTKAHDRMVKEAVKSGNSAIGIINVSNKRLNEHAEMSKITDNVYITNYETSLDIDILKQHNVKTIVCITLYAKPENVLSMYKQNGIKHYHLKCDDVPYENIVKHFDQIKDQLNSLPVDSVILFHCMAGVSRSPACAMLYLMSKGSKFDDAYNLVKSKRKITGPNDGFMAQMKRI